MAADTGDTTSEGGTRSTHLEKYTLNDLNARWVSEAGLYDLASSKQHLHSITDYVSDSTMWPNTYCSGNVQMVQSTSGETM